MSVEPENRGSRFWVLWFWVLVLGSGLARCGSSADRGAFVRWPLHHDDVANARRRVRSGKRDDRGPLPLVKDFSRKARCCFQNRRRIVSRFIGGMKTCNIRSRLIVVRATKTRWKSAEGVTIGVSLRTLERLNRRPFRLSGFAWDGGGGVRNWSGGVLDRQPDHACRVSATLAPLQNADGSMPQ